LCAQKKDSTFIDSTLAVLQKVPTKYINTIDKKIDKYSSRITKKTEKTLTKLAKWEEKIKTALQKVNPEAANKLFGASSPLGRSGGANQLTFASLLQKIKQGEQIKLDYRRQYNKYNDDVTTSFKYLEKGKAYLDSGLARKVQATKEKLQQLNSDEDSTEAIKQFIKERKKELITTAFKYIGKSKYLTKMNKEVWYYAETMKNYKEILSDEEKTEKLVKDVLNKIPGFQNFVQNNSMLASLFGSPGGGDVASAANYAGLQTRAGVQSLIQQRIAAGGTGAQEIFKQNMKDAQAQLNQYKDKLLKSPAFDEMPGEGGGSSPQGRLGGAPNMQKTKTFLQRLEFGSNLQFAKNNTLMPTTADIALTVGYKLNDKSVAGIGTGYKLGMGSIDKIRFSTEGINLRSFLEWKLKKQFYATGGWEMNYLTGLNRLRLGTPLGDGGWQQSALMGISKKFAVKTKWFKQTKVQLLYDFLARKHVPASQPVVFRIGYQF
jgi:hypothetical protein